MGHPVLGSILPPLGALHSCFTLFSKFCHFIVFSSINSLTSLVQKTPEYKNVQILEMVKTKSTDVGYVK
jgi:hypothetical protein